MADGVTIGTRAVWGGDEPFGLSRADRRQHLYAIGKTGTGKTTFLRNLILQDIEAGEGVGVIDPHGDLAQELLDFIPRWRTDHVVYFDPTDPDWSVGFNLVQARTPRERHLVASGVVSAFKAIWHDSWGARLEYFLYACVAALLECEDVSILGVQKMLVDEEYRDWVIRQVKDPAIRSFWTEEFPSYDDRFLSETLSPVRNKVGQLIMAPPMRHVLGQVRSTFDARFMMDHGRILIANLSKGRLGFDKANLLGALLVTQFQLAAMGRPDVPEVSRRDFYLYIDEFHNFSTESFASILSEARKYRLCLTLAHQYIDQLSESTRDAVFGNVGSIVCFRAGEADAEVVARQLGEYPPSTLTSLGDYEVCARLLGGGRSGQAILGRTLPPTGRRRGRAEHLIRRSRERYSRTRRVIEDRIERWLNR